ncbi:Glycosyltransferase, family GT47 [Zostera marina]|uniref:Glycosyltransferase, family GT47 n=1 Tax=Zostera marina TaxID=29655 RepID=A0A0K9Q091_ZOSMR|nr:Glycosyltransferase, family GT47 [Zostera marina]
MSVLFQMSKGWKTRIILKPQIFVVIGLFFLFILLQQQSTILSPKISQIPIPILDIWKNITDVVVGSGAISNPNPVQEKNICSISDMEDLLYKSRASHRLQVPNWPSEVDRQMMHAREEIEKAPTLTDEQQLYQPIFRNLSTFKRSYELMEKILKVYVYKEGDKPVFHQPFFRNLYASEGWFMNQMESSTEFRVDDPSKAHLFYIPFSSVHLRKKYCPPGFHSKRIMIQHLNNFTLLVSSKYPFWNRTDGADHFLIGCHDWAHAVTKKSSMHTAIRGLCTSDVKLGFEIGKDIALPATKVLVKLDPHRNIGGRPAEKRSTLVFFAGSLDSRTVRQNLVQYWEKKDPTMLITGRIPPLIEVINTTDNKPIMVNSYVHYMKNSKYCISPRGYEVWSPRLMETIFYGCVPIIMSDNFVPPLFDVLNWSEFSVILPEKEVPNLKQILMDIPHWRYLELEKGVREVRRHFLWNIKPVKYDIFHMILHSAWSNRMYQIGVQSDRV